MTEKTRTAYDDVKKRIAELKEKENDTALTEVERIGLDLMTLVCRLLDDGETILAD